MLYELVHCKNAAAVEDKVFRTFCHTTLAILALFPRVEHTFSFYCHFQFLYMYLCCTFLMAGILTLRTTDWPITRLVLIRCLMIRCIFHLMLFIRFYSNFNMFSSLFLAFALCSKPLSEFMRFAVCWYLNFFFLFCQFYDCHYFH